MSSSHFAVGLIHYERSAKGERPGYLVYVKASLTGSEPVDLNSYKAEHPTFPHQSTADQWFTESQFDSYRVLGLHIGEALSRVSGRRKPKHLPLEELFSALRRAAHPSSDRVSNYFTNHAEKLKEMLADLSGDADLQFLDRQLFPDTDRFRKERCERADEAEPMSRIPTDPRLFRKGFYFCNRLLQLMENMFIDLDLGRESDHPDNRGSLNLFNHWASASMVRLTWAISASTYGSRFQKFCDEHFGLNFEEVRAFGQEVTEDELLDLAKASGANREFTSQECVRLREVVRELGKLRKSAGGEAEFPRIARLWAFYLPLPDDLDLGGTERDPTVPCGFAVTNEKGEIVFFRLRNHLRGLGLSRRALSELKKKPNQKLVLAHGGREVYEEIVRDPKRGRYFEILLHSMSATR